MTEEQPEGFKYRAVEEVQDDLMRRRIRTKALDDESGAWAIAWALLELVVELSDLGEAVWRVSNTLEDGREPHD